MKKQWIWILLGGVLMISLLAKNAHGVSAAPVERFLLSYTNGSMANSNVVYEFFYKEGRPMVSVKPMGVPEEEAVCFETNEAFAASLQALLQQHKVSRWDGFAGSDTMVLDGDSFSLNITFQDESSLSAHGYMKWPKGYGEFEKAVDELFGKAMDEHMPLP